MNLFDILPTDVKFYDSPFAGDPACICSRCHLPIGEDDVPIRAWPEVGGYEYRFHPKCVGAT
jgi:hypothetical protein